MESGLQGQGGLAGRQPVPGERGAVEPHAHRGDVRLRLEGQIDHAGDVAHGRRRLFAEAAQHREIVAEYLDGHIGPRARQHVVDAMRDRLADGDVGAGHERQPLSNLVEHDLARPPALAQPHVYLGRLHPLHVLVELGPPRPPAGGRHLGHLQEKPLDGAAERARLGQARPRQGHRADDQRALVERGQERAPQERGRSSSSSSRQQAGRRQHRARAPQGAGQQPRVAAPHGGGQGRLAGRRRAAGQQIEAEHRRQRQGHQQRRRQRDEVHQPQGLQQPPLDAGQKEDGQHHQPHDQGGEDDGRADLAARFVHDAEPRAALRGGAARVLAQAPADVLDVDDGVVDQRAHGDGHAPEGHAVDGQPQRAQPDHRGQQRQRDGEQGDGPRPRAGEEEQGHRGHEQRAVAQRAGQVAHRELDEVGLPEQPRVELHAGRQTGLHVVEHAIELARQRQRVDVGLPVDAEDDGGPPVARSVPAAERGADLDRGHVRDPDGAGAARPDDRRGDGFDVRQPAHALNQVLLAPRLPEPGRRVPVGAPQRVFDRGERQPVVEQPIGFDQHLELAALAADHRHLGDPGDGEKPPADDHVGGGAQLDGRVRRRLQRHEHDLAHDRRHRGEHRRRDHVGERGGRRRQLFGDGLAGPVDVFAPVEVDPDHGEPDRRGRAHPPHSRRAVHHRLDGQGDQRLHVRRGHAPALDQHRHRRRGQVGQHVDRHLPQDDAAPRQERAGAREHRQAVAQRPADERIEHQSCPRRGRAGRAPGGGR